MIFFNNGFLSLHIIAASQTGEHKPLDYFTQISVPTHLPDGFVHHCFINYPASVTLIFKSSCCLIQKTIPSALSVAGQWIKHLLAICN